MSNIIPIEDMETPQNELVEQIADTIADAAEGLLNDEGVDMAAVLSLANAVCTELVGNLGCRTCDNWNMEGEGTE